MHRYLLIYLLCVTLGCQNKEASGPVQKSNVEVMEKTIQQPDENIDYIMGRFQPSEHSDFEKIDPAYADRAGLYLRKEAYAAFKRMHTEAKKAGIHLVIRSAARNFDYQKGIWERKWHGQTPLSDGVNARTDIVNDTDRARKILMYSAMPGTSRHHWGTDIDLNAFENQWFESGEGRRLYNWMTQHGPTYGFCQPYTPKGVERANGYEEEKWHWSYLPIAKRLTRYAQNHFEDSFVEGFAGANTAPAIGVKENYILGIHASCL